MASRVVDAGPHPSEVPKAVRDEARTLRGNGQRSLAEANRLINNLMDIVGALEKRVHMLEQRRG